MNQREERTTLFRFDWQDHMLPSNDAAAFTESTSILLESRGHQPGGAHYCFSDLAFYADLCERYTDVRLSGVLVMYTDYVKGCRAIYEYTRRQEGRPNEKEEAFGPEHFSDFGYYAYHSRRPNTRTLLRLEPGEHLVKVRVNQGEIVDQLVFVTNRGRIVRFGGDGGSPEAEEEEANAGDGRHRKIVAFAGTFRGVLGRFGYYAKTLNWEVVKPLVLLGQLVEQRRAFPQPLHPALVHSWEPVLHWLVIDSPTGVYRQVLSFLIDA